MAVAVNGGVINLGGILPGGSSDGGSGSDIDGSDNNGSGAGLLGGVTSTATGAVDNLTDGVGETIKNLGTSTLSGQYFCFLFSA